MVKLGTLAYYFGEDGFYATDGVNHVLQDGGPNATLAPPSRPKPGDEASKRPIGERVH